MSAQILFTKCTMLLTASALLSGCSCGEEPPIATDPPPTQGCETLITWDGFAQGFFRDWCTACHSSALVGDARIGAPEGMNFDTYEGVIPFRDRMLVRAVAEARDTADTGAEGDVDLSPMPPAGGVAPEDITYFEEWLTCGMPRGADTTAVDPCAVLHAYTGDVFSAQSAELGATYNQILGTLHVDANADLSWVCQVEGDVLVKQGPTTVALDRLTHVTGDFIANSGTGLLSLSAPVLETVDGDLRIEGQDQLADLELAEVITVGGDLIVTDSAGFQRLAFSDLRTVGGDFRVERNSEMTHFDCSRIESIGLDFTISENKSITEFSCGTVLTDLGGSLSFDDNEAFASDFYTFDILTNIPGDLSISRNADIRTIEGFYLLETIAGSVDFSENAALEVIGDFGSLNTIGGHFIIEDNASLMTIRDFALLQHVGLTADAGEGIFRIAKNPVLQGGTGPLNSVVHVQGIEVVENGFGTNPFDVTLITLFTSLTDVDADVLLQDNPHILELGVFSKLSRVNGDVVISGNEDMTSLTGFVGGFGEASIGGDLQISGNQSLLGLTLGNRLGAVIGEVRIEQNAQLAGILGPANIQFVGSLYVGDSPSLLSVGQWDSLTTTGGDLHISNADALLSLAGLETVADVGENLWIEDNASLESLQDLASVGSVGNDVRIVGNETLPDADAQELVFRVGLENIGGTVVITDNGG